MVAPIYQKIISWYDDKYFEDRLGYMLNKRRLNKIINQIFKYQHRQVLDVGCGMGELVKLMQLFNIEAQGIDFSPSAEKYFFDDRYFKLAYAHDLPFEDGSFDMITAMDVLEHIPEEDVDAVYNEFKRVLVPEGKILAMISFKHEKRKQDTHITVKPKKWWMEKMPGIKIIN